MPTWVSFHGESMVPFLKPGDALLVELGDSPLVGEGDLVVTGPFRLEGNRVWSAHRVVGKGGGLATKGDAACEWDPPSPLVGRVLGVRRGAWRVVWGERGPGLKRWSAWFSRRMRAGPKGRPARVGLKALALIEMALQLGRGNVRRDTI